MDCDKQVESINVSIVKMMSEPAKESSDEDVFQETVPVMTYTEGRHDTALCRATVIDTMLLAML